MRRILGRQQRQVLSIEADSIEMNEVRIASFLLTDAAEVQQPVLLIDPEQLRDVPFTRRDLILEPARLQIVEIQLSPVIAL